ncbi:hypothetical protein SD457_06670 [Coprobacillaceae bacterium CR2/5/TPMF4]|nr:hypothetical protein SD457_06670 [Coprobacillaceae bacterium CR2/5/TPMF4]
MWWLFGYTEKIHTPSRPIKDPNKNNPNNKIKELQERYNKLERTLDKSCGELSNMFNDIDDKKITWSAEEWKEWCLNEN